MNKELSKFVKACISKGECEEIGDSKKGNRQFKIIHSVYILLADEERLEELLSLLEHENPYVRLWAAAYSLKTAPLKAEHTLEELSKTMKSPVGFSAAMTLREWRNGSLKLS